MCRYVLSWWRIRVRSAEPRAGLGTNRVAASQSPEQLAKLFGLSFAREIFKLRPGIRLPVVLKFPEGTRNVTEPALRELSDSLVERRLIEVDSGLAGSRIEFAGLQAT